MTKIAKRVTGNKVFDYDMVLYGVKNYGNTDFLLKNKYQEFSQVNPFVRRALCLVLNLLPSFFKNKIFCC